MNKPQPHHWQRASRLLESVVKLELVVTDETNDWRYSLTIVDPKGQPMQSLEHTSPRTYRLGEMEAVQRELMTYRAGMALAFAQQEETADGEE